MQVTETLSEGLKRNYIVVLPGADLESRRMERLTTLGKTLRLPGFRPGKVPMPIVKQRFGNAVSAEVMEQSVSEATQKVLSERGLRPAQQPKVDVVTDNPSALTGDLEFKVELELLPDITLPDLAAIELTRVKAEVEPEAVDKALAQIANYNRTLEPIPEETLEARGHGAATGEVVTVDYEGKIDGVAFEGGKGEDTPVEIGGDGFIPGFAEQLEGAKPGEQRTLNVTFPEAYGKAELAGKAATFDITVKQVSTQTIPPIDDDLAKKLGADTLDALREIIVGRQQQEYDNISRMRVKRQLLDVLSGLADFPVPPSIADQEFESIWQQFQAARKAGSEDEEDKTKDDDTLKTEYRAIAERRVRLGLLLAEIGRVNNITVTEQELDRALYQRAMQYRGQEMQMLELLRKYPQAANTVRGPLFEDKVVDFVLETARITDTVVSPEELAKELETAPTAAAATAEASDPAAPASEALASEAPAAEAPAAEALASEAEASQVPASETPASETATSGRESSEPSAAAAPTADQPAP